MRKVLLALALVGLIAAPAMAGLVPPANMSPQQANLQGSGGHTVGIYNYDPTYGPGILLDFKITDLRNSDVFTVTFAFHWPYATYVYGVQLQHNIVWDHSELGILSMNPTPFGAAGPAQPVGWGGNQNYPPATGFDTVTTYGTVHVSGWDDIDANITSGLVALGDVFGTGVPLWNNVSAFPPSGSFISGSMIVPFMQVQFHVKDVVADSFLDLFVSEAALLWFYSPTGAAGTWWTGGAIGTPFYGMGLVPEPASISLLVGGFLALGAGVYRRRRR